MKKRALENLIEGQGDERDVIVRITPSAYLGERQYSDRPVEYDVVGAEVEGPSQGEHAGPLVLLLRERAPWSTPQGVETGTAEHPSRLP